MMSVIGSSVSDFVSCCSQPRRGCRLPPHFLLAVHRLTKPKMWDEAENASYKAGHPFLDRHGVQQNTEKVCIVSRAVEIYLRGADPARWGRIIGWKEAPVL